MKTTTEKTYTFALLMLSLLAEFAFVPSALKAQPTPMGINFVDGNIDNARQIAKQQGKHILIEFTGLSCPACRKMESEVLTNTDVILLVNQYFVAIKIYVEDTIDQANWQLQEKLHPQFLPTFYIYNHDILQETIVGFKQKDDFLNILNAFLAKKVHHATTIPDSPSRQIRQEVIVKEEKNIPDPHEHIVKSNPSKQPTPKDNDLPHLAPPITDKISDTKSPQQNPKPQNTIKDNGIPIEGGGIAGVTQTPPTTPLSSNIGNRVQNVSSHLISDTATDSEIAVIYKGSLANMDDQSLREICYRNKSNYKNYEQFVEEYIKRHGKDIVQKDGNFVFDFAIRLDDSASKLLLSNIDAVKDIYGAQKVENQLTQAARQLLTIAIGSNNGNGDDVAFDGLTNAIKTANIMKQDSLLFEIKSQYYQGTRNWEKYHQICCDYFSKHKDNPDLLMGQARAHLLHIDRKEMLQEALQWAETALEIEPSAEAYFVVGALHNKLQNKEAAIEALVESIDWSKTQKSDDILARELLEKITR